MGNAAVADGIGDQFADHEFRCEGEVVQSPGLELAVRVRACSSDNGGVGGHVPGGDLVGVEGSGAGDQQCDIVVRHSSEKRAQNRVTGGLE